MQIIANISLYMGSMPHTPFKIDAKPNKNNVPHTFRKKLTQTQIKSRKSWIICHTQGPECTNTKNLTKQNKGQVNVKVRKCEYKIGPHMNSN